MLPQFIVVCLSCVILFSISLFTIIIVITDHIRTTRKGNVFNRVHRGGREGRSTLDHKLLTFPHHELWP